MPQDLDARVGEIQKIICHSDKCKGQETKWVFAKEEVNSLMRTRVVYYWKCISCKEKSDVVS